MDIFKRKRNFSDFPPVQTTTWDWDVRLDDDLTQALREQAAASRHMAGQIRELRVEMEKSNAVAASINTIGLREAQRALADMISGQLGGRPKPGEGKP